MIRLLALVLLLALPAAAQDILGQSQINGRGIIVRDDFTWSFVEEEASQNAGCANLAGAYVFCGNDLGWEITAKLSPDADASFRLDDRNYAAVIREERGAKDGMTLDVKEQAMIASIAAAASVTPEDVVIYGSEDMVFLDIPARRVIYGVVYQDRPLIYHNTVWISDTETIQFFTLALTSEPTEAILQTHLDAIASIRKLN